jgi:hypothetical protein
MSVGAVSQLLGNGYPRSDNVRSEMEGRFGADFSQVRIHDDARDAVARAAKASP